MMQVAGELGVLGLPGTEVCHHCLMPAGLGVKPKRQAGTQDGFLRCEPLLLRKDPKNQGEVDCMAGQKV